MTTPKTVAVLVGSLRKASYNRLVAGVLAQVAPPSLSLKIVEIGDLALYNDDVEAAGPPAAWTRFRGEITAADAVLFVTPEYNRSMPAAMKNALDVGSRPYGKNVWNAKPGAVVSASAGSGGGFGANHHVRQSLVFLNVPAMAQPEAYIGGVAALFDDKGALTNEGTRAFLTTFMTAFAGWVETNG